MKTLYFALLTILTVAVMSCKPEKAQELPIPQETNTPQDSAIIINNSPYQLQQIQFCRDTMPFAKKILGNWELKYKIDFYDRVIYSDSAISYETCLITIDTIYSFKNHILVNKVPYTIEIILDYNEDSLYYTGNTLNKIIGCDTLRRIISIPTLGRTIYHYERL